MPHIIAYILIGLFGLFSLALDPVYAEGSSDGSSNTSSGSGAAAPNPLFASAQQAIADKDYSAAVPLLQQVTSAEPRNADAWNLLGFSNRKLGNMDEAAKAYHKALKINPGHLGALEYQGEMYVQLGDLKKAKANLSRLQSLCGACEEMVDLQEAIDSAKS